jgi:hypothetical protein
VDDSLYYIGRIIFIEDIPWMIERLEASDSEDIQRTWAVLVEKRFRQSELKQTDTILTACQRSPILAEALSWLREPVEIDSPEAQQAKAQYLEMQKWQNLQQNRPILDPPPAQRISNLLNACEQGNLDAWWRLIMEMTLESHSTHYGDDLEPDLTVLPGWKHADTVIRKRILEAAKQYVVEQRPQIQKWLEGNIVNHPTFAGYKALWLLQQEEPDWLITLTTDVWQKWAPTILAYPVSGSAKKQTYQGLVKRAYGHAPTQIIETLEALIDKENKESHGQISILREIECCWDDHLASALLKKLQGEQLKPNAFGCILCSLLDHNVEEAKILASTLVLSQSSSDQGQRFKAIIAARVLLTHANDAGWSIVWPVIQGDKAFGQEVIAAAYDFRTRDIQITRMTEDQLADFYVWLSQQYPHMEDPKREGAHDVSARESIADFRDSVLRYLKDLGTLAACEAIEKIARELPQLDWLKWTLLEARNIARQKTWVPPKPRDILEIAKNQQGRLVQSGEQLLEVVIESLQRLEQRLQGETPQVEFLWDQVKDKQWKPKDENSFSNYVKNHLDLDLKQKGIIVNREVEIRRRPGNPLGERVDIQVDAVSKQSNGEEYDRISVIIEVKGCWHDKLNEAMKTQLIDRYLNEAHCQHGLYLIGWFNCTQWKNTNDSRQKKAPQLTLKEARDKFDFQAQGLSQSKVMVKAFVMNTALLTQSV